MNNILFPSTAVNHRRWKLCETLGLNAPLLMFMSVAFVPFSIMVIHLLVAAKLDAYFSDGGG